MAVLNEKQLSSWVTEDKIIFQENIMKNTQYIILGQIDNIQFESTSFCICM